MKIGIIGFGYVGSALSHGFSSVVDVLIYDKYNNIYYSLGEVVEKSDFLFVCVPTPVNDEGGQDLSNMDDALKSISLVAKEGKIIILKSTLIPGTTRKYAVKYKQHDFIYCPEFLTERNAKLDFINTSRIVIGGNFYLIREKVERLYRTRFTHTPIYKTSWEAAEILKYMCNSFFAVKLSFLNEMYDITNQFLNVSFEDMRDMWLSDFRIGNSHKDVPGPDGDRGYGGKCLPKDVKSFISWAEKRGLKLDMCKAADKVNERVRTNKDWLEIKGATTKNNY